MASISELCAEVTAVLVAGLPAMTAETAAAVLNAAKADDGHPLRRLHRFLLQHPDALAVSMADPPAVFVRLAQTLHERGYATVPLPGCTNCGRQDRQLNRRDQQGRRVCTTCYQPPQRRCGRCGRLRPVRRRSSNNGPDLCSGCYQGNEGTCSICGQVRVVHRASDGSLRCQHCIPRNPRRCAECARSAPVQAQWPIGPVCVDCYTRVRANPATCPTCRHRRPLVGVDATGGRVCGPCAGTSNDHACRTCTTAGDLYANQRCSRCVLTDRIHDLLKSADPALGGQLAPLAAALTSAPRPRSVLRWLATSPSARLIRQFAAGDQLISHEMLDALPVTTTVHNTRSLLVETGILPARVEHLERIQPWLEQTLATVPTPHARLIRQYAHWALLRRARRRPRYRPYTPSAADGIRLRITTALAFLTWLHHQGLHLSNVHQPDLDRWLTEGDAPTVRATLRPFIQWARQRHLADNLEVLPTPVPAAATFQSDEQQWEQLNRCLHDESLPLDVRLAGALVLTFGLPVTRLPTITLGQVERHADTTYLQAGRHRLLVPPALARLLAQQQERAANRWSVTSTAGPDRPLFPGLHGRPAHPDALRAKLTRHGLRPRAGRNTALAGLAADLPPVVLAGILGVGITTATRWANHARRDWAPYVADRATTRRETAPSHVTRPHDEKAVAAGHRPAGEAR